MQQPVCIGVVLAYVFISWFTFARLYFVGPINHIEEELNHIPEAGGNKDMIDDMKGLK